MTELGLGLATSKSSGDGLMGVILHLETGNQILMHKATVHCYLSLESGGLKIVMTKNLSSATKVCVIIIKSCFACCNTELFWIRNQVILCYNRTAFFKIFSFFLFFHRKTPMGDHQLKYYIMILLIS